jgi:hypothetical protein
LVALFNPAHSQGATERHRQALVRLLFYTPHPQPPSNYLDMVGGCRICGGWVSLDDLL